MTTPTLLRQTAIVIDSDTVEVFNHVAKKEPMWDGTGPRTVELNIRFKRVFAYAPTVSTGLVGIDSSHAQNLRFRQTVKDITKDGFIIEFHTWGDTKIARALVNWTAIGLAVG